MEIIVAPTGSGISAHRGNMDKRLLAKDMKRLEVVLENTVNGQDQKYIYTLAVILWHILSWIARQK